MLKIHFDTDPDKHKSATQCGVEFWHDKNTAGEGDTALDHRIQLTDEIRRVTCKRCAAAIKAVFERDEQYGR